MARTILHILTLTQPRHIHLKDPLQYVEAKIANHHDQITDLLARDLTLLISSSLSPWAH